MPIKCPVAPLEFCFLADWYFTDRGIRDQSRSRTPPLSTPPSPSPSPQASSAACWPNGHRVVTEFNTGEVDGEGRLVGYDGREVPFDLAVVMPLHGGAPYVGRSAGLGDELDFVPTDQHTLQAKAAPNVFVIGDAADVPASKAGSVAHFEGETLVGNVQRFLADSPSKPASTATPTASSRPGSTRPCSSTSTTRPSPCRGASRTRRAAAAAGVAAQPPRQEAVRTRVLEACSPAANATVSARRCRHRGNRSRRRRRMIL